jgi:hypothetical protein
MMLNNAFSSDYVCHPIMAATAVAAAAANKTDKTMVVTKGITCSCQ